MTTQTVSGRRYFTKAWLMEQKSLIAYRSAGADRDCLDVKPELFHHQ